MIYLKILSSLLPSPTIMSDTKRPRGRPKSDGNKAQLVIRGPIGAPVIAGSLVEVLIQDPSTLKKMYKSFTSDKTGTKGIIINFLKSDFEFICENHDKSVKLMIRYKIQNLASYYVGIELSPVVSAVNTLFLSKLDKNCGSIRMFVHESRPHILIIDQILLTGTSIRKEVPIIRNYDYSEQEGEVEGDDHAMSIEMPLYVLKSSLTTINADKNENGICQIQGFPQGIKIIDNNNTTSEIPATAATIISKTGEFVGISILLKLMTLFTSVTPSNTMKLFIDEYQKTILSAEDDNGICQFFIFIRP